MKNNKIVVGITHGDINGIGYEVIIKLLSDNRLFELCTPVIYGSHVMISGGSLVRKDVPPFIKAAREPLTYAGVNSIGLRRRGFENDQIRDIQEIYRYTYQKGLNNTDACDLIEAELPATKERDEIILFIRNSKRGIIRGYFQ